MSAAEQDIPTVEVGGDVMSLCSKCGDHWHVVVSQKEDLIDKCECKGCGRAHKYKPQDPEVIESIKAFKKARKAAASGKTPRAPRKKAIPKAPVVTIDPEKPLITYSIRTDYDVGDQIDHKKFGHGLVAELIGPDKMVVHFVDQGSKTMLRARA